MFRCFAHKVTRLEYVLGHFHESSVCFEYPQNPYLNQATLPKNTNQIFLPQKSRNRKFQTLKNPLTISVP